MTRDLADRTAITIRFGNLDMDADHAMRFARLIADEVCRYMKARQPRYHDTATARHDNTHRRAAVIEFTLGLAGDPPIETLHGSWHSPAADLIANERRRQILEEGYDAAHDHESHGLGDLAKIGGFLATGVGSDPWGLRGKHGHDVVRRYTIAAALIAAEIDMQLRFRARGNDLRNTVPDGP